MSSPTFRAVKLMRLSSGGEGFRQGLRKTLPMALRCTRMMNGKVLQGKAMVSPAVRLDHVIDTGRSHGGGKPPLLIAPKPLVDTRDPNVHSCCNAREPVMRAFRRIDRQ